MPEPEYVTIIRQRCPFEVWIDHEFEDTIVKVAWAEYERMALRLSPRCDRMDALDLSDLVLGQIYFHADWDRRLEEANAILERYGQEPIPAHG